MIENNLPVILIGAGGHAKVLINLLNLCGREVIGITDVGLKKDDIFCEYKIMGDDEVIKSYETGKIELVNAIGSVPGNSLRWQIARRFFEAGYDFAKLVHPSAIVSADVEMSQGVQVMAGCVIQPGTCIGNSSIVNTGAIIDHDCNIEMNCHLAPGVTLSGTVSVGENTHIGTGTSVIQGVKIGRNCVIASGSVIYRDVPDNTHFIQKRIT